MSGLEIGLLIALGVIFLFLWGNINFSWACGISSVIGIIGGAVYLVGKGIYYAVTGHAPMVELPASSGVAINMGPVADFFLAFAFLFSGAWIFVWLFGFMIIASCFWYDDKNVNGIWITVGAALLWFLLWPNSWPTFTGYIWTMVTKAIPLYIGGGILWSFYKWRITMGEMAEQIRNGLVELANRVAEGAEEVKKPRPDQKLSISAQADWTLDDLISAHNYPAGYFLTDDQLKAQDFIPKLKKRGNARAKIINWICFWPFSVVNYIFGKLLRDLMDFIVNFFTRVYNALTRWALGDLIKATPKP